MTTEQRKKRARRETTKTIKMLEKIAEKRLTLGSLIQSIRLGEEETQAIFAKRLKISKQYLSDLENRRRFTSPKMAATFAKKLGYSEEQFVRLCLQDLIEREGLKFEIEIRKAA